MNFRHYTDADREALIDFFIALNRPDKNHINWNWARFEWMAEHPEFDRANPSAFGLWTDGGRIVGAAVYDMYFGEAFCGALQGYETLYPTIIDYSYRELKDENGLMVAACSESAGEIAALLKAGFIEAQQTETLMSIPLAQPLSSPLPAGLRFGTLDPAQDPYAFQWLLWQGFGHGGDRAQFEREEQIVPRIRRYFDRRLSVTAVDDGGEPVAYCCLWYSDKTDYAYVEPLCVIPAYRGKGTARALLFEALTRAWKRGAEKAYVISDMDFYRRLGFAVEKRFTFYHKP